ncbi:centromere-associated protein E-like isoform X2 [Saccostrea cucullata]|uniref:centromere-associated protein E-like isoform X2 n=1 Tax=Saccostrea cuccullata TaxID=36930 RepID=UPI002ED002D1
MACSIEDTQDSVDTQTDQIDDDEIRQKVGDLRVDLNQLRANNSYVLSGHQAREGKLTQMKDYHTILSSGMSEFLGTMSELRNKILAFRAEGHRADQEINRLQEEKAILNEEEELLANQCTPRIGEEENALIERNLTEEEKIELQLYDYTRCDLYRKLRCLQELKDTAQKIKSSYRDEWNKIKDDIKKYSGERRHYELEIQNVQNMALLKMRSMQLNPADAEDQEILELIKYLEMKREIRELREDNINLEVMSRDIEDDIGQLLGTKKALLKENDILEQELRPKDEPGTLLHRTSRHTNLVIRDDRFTDQSEDATSIGELYDHVGGTHLHRCAKNSCIAIPRELWDKEELEELERLMSNNTDSEESSDITDDVTDDVSSDDVNIELSEEEQQKIASEEKVDSKELQRNVSEKPNQSSDLQGQMHELAAGNSQSLMSKLRARMGVQAQSGTALRPEVMSSGPGIRSSSLRDAALSLIKRRQRRN